MNYYKLVIKVVLVFTFYFLLFPKNVHAYVDPGTGSYILQIVAAMVFGSIFALKLYWGKIKYFFTSLFIKKDGAEKENTK